jgi:hypothetical protein
VKYLLEHGAKVDVKDDMGRTAMTIVDAGRGGRDSRASEIVTLLKSAAAN